MLSENLLGFIEVMLAFLASIIGISAIISNTDHVKYNRDNVKIKFQRIDKHRPYYAPTLGSKNAAGWDLKATDAIKWIIEPGETIVFRTNIRMEIPEGYYLDICSRSGLSIKEGIVVQNSPARIDSDYRGEILIALHNTSNSDVKIELGQRIAQCTLHKLINTKFNEYPYEYEFSTTERGEGKFGHSGKM